MNDPKPIDPARPTKITLGQQAPKNASREPRTQAERVIRKFGNARRLAHFLHLVEPCRSFTASAIYRWTYPSSKGGRDGVIPPRNLPLILLAARLAGIVLTAEDLSPLPTPPVAAS